MERISRIQLYVTSSTEPIPYGNKKRMPQIEIIKKTCFVCNRSSRQHKNASLLLPGTAGPSGIVELEGRPKELTEFILRSQLEFCPHCRYIAEDIGEKTSITNEYLQSPEYCNLLNPEIPFASSLYLRAAQIQEKEKNLEKSIEYYISAAWCADSIVTYEFAVSCRRKALSLIFAENKTFADIPSQKWIPILDLIRRCGDFDLVITHCTNLLPIAGPVLHQELDFELLCAKQGDSGPHTNLEVGSSNQCRPGIENTDEEFIIDGKPYSVEVDCFGNGWNWVAETRTLILSNYHGTAINAPGDITIRLGQIDNQINSSHGPGIYVRHGNLKLLGAMFLTINGDEGGIFVESGTLEITGVILKIRTKKYGIFASGTISITGKSVIDICSETTAIRSMLGGLNVIQKTVLKIYGLSTGIDLAGDFNSFEGMNQIESPNGCGILSRKGSLTFTGCTNDFICGDTCIFLENGILTLNRMQGTLHGTSCVQVNGSCNIVASMVHLSGEDNGLFVSEDMEIYYSKCESSGKSAINVGGNLQISNVNISASGETGLSVGGDMKSNGGILKLEGDTAMQISGNVEISDGLIIGIGKICGIVVNGSYFQTGGDVSFTGEAQEGMRISGKEMTITEGGSLTASGRKSGLDVAGDLLLNNVVLLSASGNVGISVGKSLVIEYGNLKVAGEEIGLSMRDGNFTMGATVTVVVTGNVGIYSTKDIGIHGGSLQVTGEFGGIVLESGNLIITDGAIEISGDEYGILLQSGSMNVRGGIITITNPRMMDSGGFGIAVEKGNLDLGSLMTINGVSYAISVPCGDISLKHGKIEAHGFRAGVMGKSLTLKDAILTAYGKTGGAVVLTGRGPWNDKGVIYFTEKSAKTATTQVYSGQKFVHIFTVHLPDTS